MFKIGEFSRLAGISVRMLRHYNDLEILIPVKIDTQTGYRYYEAKQLKTVNQIKQLQALGFTLQAIKEIVNTSSEATLTHFFTTRKQEVTDELKKIKEQEELIRHILENQNEQLALLEYRVEKKSIPAHPVISLKKKISDYSKEGELWTALFEEIEKHHVKLSATPVSTTLYHDDEYKETNMEIEVQVSTDDEHYSSTDDVQFYTTQPMTVASVTFHGSYEQMPMIAQAVAYWMEINHYELNGPMLNIFHVSPAQDINPDNWITEACYQIKPQIE